MKILIATGLYPPDIGGPATYSKFLADELPGKGIPADVLSFGSVRRLPRVLSHIVYTVKLLWHARAVDAVFAQDTVSVGLPACLAAFVLGKPFIVRVPGDYAWEQARRFGVTASMEAFQKGEYGFKLESLRKLEKFVVNQAEKVIVPSRSFAAIVRTWVKNPDKVSAIYNGIDLDEAHRLSDKIKPGAHTIISAGRLVTGKGFDPLIRFMKDLPDWRLEIAGDGPERDNLQKTIAKEGLIGRVALLGRLERPELLRKIAGSEIFALNTAFETFSYQVVEAMAVGTPVITTGVGSLPEIIDDGQNGILIAPDDRSSFVAAVKKISADQNLKKALISSAKTKSQTFSIKSTADAVGAVVADLVNSSSPFRQKKAAAAKIIRYIISGGTAAATDLILLYVFTDIFGIWYVLSSILAFLVAFVVSFVLQKFFTFQDHDLDGVHGQALLYLFVTAGNLVLNTVLIYSLVHFTGLHYLISQVLTSIAIAIESFIIYRMFIFAPSTPSNL